MSARSKQHVLIAGGGVAALEAALALHDLASELLSVELLAPEPRFWYRPLAVAEPFRLGKATHHELAALTRAMGASFTPAALTGVDPWRRVVHTSQNTEIAYDHLLVACGAVPVPAISGALTFRGPADTQKIEELLTELVHDDVDSVAFVIPWGAVWSLPAYELALLTSSYLHEHGAGGARLHLVTPEEQPLQLFGRAASKAMRDLLSQRQISLRSGSYASEIVDGELRLLPEGAVAADRFVALPRLRGAPIDGIPQTVNGFVPVDRHCRVHGLENVYAAGDITSFTVKPGGHRDPAGGRRGAGDRSGSRSGDDRGAIQTRASRPPPHRTRAALPPTRAQRPARAGAGRDDRAAVVASGEDRWSPPCSLPRLDRRPRLSARLLRGGSRRGRAGSRARARAGAARARSREARIGVRRPRRARRKLHERRARRRAGGHARRDRRVPPRTTRERRRRRRPRTRHRDPYAARPSSGVCRTGTSERRAGATMDDG
jgi:sulfide:quinone oxidoreductase